MAINSRCNGCFRLLPAPSHSRSRNPRKWCSEACRVRTFRTRGSGAGHCMICDRTTCSGDDRCGYCTRYESAESKLFVFERDSWTCGICGGDIDRALIYPVPMAATVDHIHPLSRGGGHELGNVQAAHFRCNIRKSNKVPAEAVA